MADEELTERQSVKWGAGSFDEVAEVIGDGHEAGADALLPAQGDVRDYLLIAGTRR